MSRAWNRSWLRNSPYAAAIALAVGAAAGLVTRNLLLGVVVFAGVLAGGLIALWELDAFQAGRRSG